MEREQTLAGEKRNASRLKQARAEVTRAAVMSAARKIFANAGYHAASISDIVEAAQVTRGGLYYHFTEKRDLFEAVYREVQVEKFADVVKAVEPITQDIWSHFVEALKHLLKMTASDAEIQQIVLLDGPAVLGWQKWSAIKAELSGEVTANELKAMMDRGIVKPLNPSVVTHLILVALNEASLTIAHADNPNIVLGEATDALVALLEGLKV